MPLHPMNRTTTAQTITEYFAEKIRSGEYQSGDRLPSERELMAQLSVARSTIREAMQSLYSRNLIEIRAGEGTFVKGYDVTETLHTQLKRILDDETTMDDLLEAQQLLASFSRYSAERKEAESSPNADMDEITSRFVSPSQNRVLGIFSDIVKAAIEHRQRNEHSAK